MNELVSIIVVSGAPAGGVQRTVESATAQPLDRIEVLVVGTRHGGRVASPPATLSDVPVREVESSSFQPGARRNAGVRASQGSVLVCLEGGDLLLPTFCLDALQALTREDADYVMAPALMNPGDAPLMPEIPSRPDPDTLASVTWCAPAALMFRRAAWEAAGGFDEALDSLGEYDFLLKLCRIGRRGLVLSRPGLRHTAGRGTVFRQALEADAYLAGLRVILACHAPIFEADPATAIFGRERLLRELVALHRDRVRRRDEHLDRLRSAVHERGRIRTFLEQDGRDRFEWGDFNRTSPVSRNWGYDRGTPVDRYYIQQFIERHAADVRGVVLEVQEDDLTARVGGSRVTRSDVLDINRDNPRATIVGDLRQLVAVPNDSYDCIILTQTLHVIDDMKMVLAECRRVLKPGGVLLATLPSSSRVCLEYGPDGDFWRVTEAGARRLFADVFPADHVLVRSFGNVQVNVAFLEGLACEDLDPAVFEAHDPYFPVVVGVRAMKPVAADHLSRPPRTRRATGPASGAILMYHRIAAPAGSDAFGLCVRPEVFANQMALLREQFHPMALADLVDAARRGALPEGAVAVTFDDGYVDAVMTARPILETHEIPATFFVTTGGLSGSREFWWDALERALVDVTQCPARLSLTDLGIADQFDMRTPEHRRKAFWTIYARLRGEVTEVRDRVVAHLLGWSGASPLPPSGATRLTVSDLHTLAASPGFAIGAHGVHHLELPAQPADRQREEVSAARQELELALGRSVTAFAYPFGAWSAASALIVRQAGFALAVTCDDGPVRPGDDPWRLPRLEVKADIGPHFDRRLWTCLARP